LAVDDSSSFIRLTSGAGMVGARLFFEEQIQQHNGQGKRLATKYVWLWIHFHGVFEPSIKGICNAWLWALDGAAPLSGLAPRAVARHLDLRRKPAGAGAAVDRHAAAAADQRRHGAALGRAADAARSVAHHGGDRKAAVRTAARWRWTRTAQRCSTAARARIAR
jgi:hypothetical protein